MITVSNRGLAYRRPVHDDPDGGAHGDQVRGPVAVAACVLAFVVTGALLGAVGAFFTPTVPLGVLLGVPGLPLLVTAGVLVSGRTSVGVGGYLAWLVVVVALSEPRHVEQAVILGTGSGTTFVYGGALLGGAALVAAPMVPVLRRRRSARG